MAARDPRSGGLHQRRAFLLERSVAGVDLVVALGSHQHIAFAGSFVLAALAAGVALVYAFDRERGLGLVEMTGRACFEGGHARRRETGGA